MKTPIAFIIFKRPDTTQKVFEAIRQAKPPKILVIADGPRPDRPGEAEKCAAARAIIDTVDWECEVLTNYSDVNLGCAKRVSSGLDWVFEKVEEAIILEDDCVPNPTFFPFCEELLEKYRYDTRISSISGQNVQFGRRRNDYSYYFSIFNHCWGWATWRRAWQNFDIYMKLWPEIKAQGLLNDILIDTHAANYWQRKFDYTYNNPLSTFWCYQWTFSCWLQNSLGIISNVNLISNIGFGIEATNVGSNTKNPYNNIPTENIDLPLRHPPFVLKCLNADRFTQNTLFKETNWQRLKQKIKKKLRIKNYYSV